MKIKRKGGAEKLRLKKMINLKTVANDPKQNKISFGADQS